MSKFFRGTIFSKGLVLVVIPLVFELTFGITMFCLQQYYREVIAQESKAKAIIYHANELWLQTTDVVVEKIEVKIFRHVTHSQDEELYNIKQEYAALQELIKDDDEQRKADLKFVKQVSDMLIDTGDEFEDQSASTEGMGDFQSKIATLRGRFSSFQRLQTQLKAFGRAIRQFRAPDVLKSRDAEVRVARVQSMIDWVIGGAVVTSVCMNAMLLLYFMRGINQGIQGLLENTKRMQVQEALLPESTAEDELGHLDRAFHQMARTVESATRRERATISNAGDMIYVLDPEFQIVSVNPAAGKLLGLDSDEIKKRGLKGLVIDDDFSAVRIAMKEVLDGAGSGTFECRLQGADGVERWTSWTVQWSAPDQEIFCVAHDITERRRLEQVKQEFFGMISHDMRTPLSSIVMSVGYLVAGAVEDMPERAMQYLQLADQSAQYLLGLMQDLLDMERLTAGAFPLKIDEFDFADVCIQAADMVKPIAGKAGLTINVPEQDGFICEGDRDALTRVVVNLISNAVKFSPSGTSIDLRLVKDDSELTVEVIDHGRGIPEELRDKVFDRFKQVEAQDKKLGGAGLGLAICKGFVEAHGGSIGVKGSGAEGSTFWFKIPLQAVVVKINPVQVHQ